MTKKIILIIIFISVLFIWQKVYAANSLHISPAIVDQVVKNQTLVDFTIRISNKSDFARGLNLQITSKEKLPVEFDLSSYITPINQSINIAARSEKTLAYQIDLLSLENNKTYNSQILISESGKKIQFNVPIIITANSLPLAVSTPIDSHDYFLETEINNSWQKVGLNLSLVNNTDIRKNFRIDSVITDKDGKILQQFQKKRSVLPKERLETNFISSLTGFNFLIWPRLFKIKTIVKNDQRIEDIKENQFYYYNKITLAIFLFITVASLIFIFVFNDNKKIALYGAIFYFMIFIAFFVSDFYSLKKIAVIDADQTGVLQQATVMPALEVEEDGNLVYISTNGHGYYLIFDNSTIIERSAPIYRDLNIIPSNASYYRIEVFY